ncbi:MAG: MarR family transcriptional regulator [Acidimicrobiales bacterium]|nr:MarR family transcriptional regulator [Acidimicrobiales bacterium]
MDSESRHGPAAAALYGLLAALLRHTPRDLSLTALATLATLERTGPRRITELAVIEGVAQPSMTNLVSNLEREGLVERRSDPDDKRVALAAITDKGANYVRSRRRLGTESLEQLLDKLSEAESTALTGAVEALTHLRLLDEEERDPAQSPYCP